MKIGLILPRMLKQPHYLKENLNLPVFVGGSNLSMTPIACIKNIRNYGSYLAYLEEFTNLFKNS